MQVASCRKSVIDTCLVCSTVPLGLLVMIFLSWYCMSVYCMSKSTSRIVVSLLCVCVFCFPSGGGGQPLFASQEEASQEEASREEASHEEASQEETSKLRTRKFVPEKIHNVVPSLSPTNHPYRKFAFIDSFPLSCHLLIG